MRFKLILVLFFVFTTCSLFAQTKDEHCGTDRLLHQWLQADPANASKLRDTRITIHNYMHASSSSVSRANTDTVITVPVVVHVIHSGQPLDSGPNISDGQIKSQIAILNECFNENWEQYLTDSNGTGIINPELVPCWFQSLIGNAGIKFCLAMYDTTGHPTTGITRDSFPYSSYSPENFDGEVKQFTQWDPSSYFNIWVTDLGGNPGGGDGVLGYGYIPSSLPAPYDDGIVVDYRYFGFTSDPNFGLGKTAVHETGHWLGLYHPFYPYPYSSGCAGMTPQDCDTSGDYICDTPPEAEAYSDAPNQLSCSCNDSFYVDACNEPDSQYYRPGNDMWMTFMDYVNDENLLMFTLDQAAEMRAVLNTVRLSIQYSAAAGSCKSGDTTLGLTELPDNGMNFSVYPNPTTGMFNLQYSTTEKGTLEIFNIMGEALMRQEIPASQSGSQVYDLSALPSGIYLIRLQTLHSQKSLKLSIVR